jgi:hypothetical protein
MTLQRDMRLKWNARTEGARLAFRVWVGSELAAMVRGVLLRGRPDVVPSRLRALASRVERELMR